MVIYKVPETLLDKTKTAQIAKSTTILTKTQNFSPLKGPQAFSKMTTENILTIFEPVTGT